LPATPSHTLPFRPVPNYPQQACKHYRDYRIELETIDDILQRSGLDEFMTQQALEERYREYPDLVDSNWGLEKFIQHSRSAFRISLLRSLKQSDSVRSLEITLADSPLYQWFCFIENFDQIKAPSKSSIDRYKNLFGHQALQNAFEMLLQKAASTPETYDPLLEGALNILGFEMPTDLLEVWYDGTCMAVNIHFPTDWVQLGDCCKSLLKTIRTIRRHGIINRMPEGGSDALLSELNQIIIAFGNARRRKDSKKLRKKTLRKLKKFSARCANHANRHRELLIEHREEKTSLTEGQSALLISNLDNILTQLPIIKKQTHDRIIGERRIKQDEKILSAYEPDINVIVRGKSGSEVEFGNQLMIGENRDGLITYFRII